MLRRHCKIEPLHRAYPDCVLLPALRTASLAHAHRTPGTGIRRWVETKPSGYAIKGAHFGIPRQSPVADAISP
jgi:hypothetical protein